MSSKSGNYDALFLDIASRQLGLGGRYNNTYSIFSGINVLGGMPPIPPNVDQQGLVLFTKPALNLSYDNVQGIRKFSYLLDDNELSMPNVIRCMLSPPESISLRLGATPKDDNRPQLRRSKIIDDKCAFMPISNLLLSLSQPPDLAADTYVSNEGVLHQQTGHIDGGPGINLSYDLTATFANMEGDPVTTIFTTWIEYAQHTQRGNMMPYPLYVLARRYDNNTRIYRLILDRTRTYVQNIYAPWAAFPYTAPLGAKFGYNREQHLSPESDQIQITFKCFGAMYDDPILIGEFNKLVGIWNRDMMSGEGMKPSKNMVKVKGVAPDGTNLLTLLNNKLYPRIDNKTMELEWYCFKETYDLVMQLLNETVFTKEKVIKPSRNIDLGQTEPRPTNEAIYNSYLTR